MHIATVIEFNTRLIPAIAALRDTIWKKAKDWVDVIKIGRTHLQDATPLTVGQEWSGYATQLDSSLELVRHSLGRLYRLAVVGTAVGTGINSRIILEKRWRRKSLDLLDIPLSVPQTSLRLRDLLMQWCLQALHLGQSLWP
jgi:fumarate hydratase class II